MKDFKNIVIAVASDHAGFDKKQVILKDFKEKGIFDHIENVYC